LRFVLNFSLTENETELVQMRLFLKSIVVLCLRKQMRYGLVLVVF